MDDNIFDDDDALDYILYEDCEKNTKKSNGGGCLSSLVVLLIPLAGVPILVTCL